MYFVVIAGTFNDKDGNQKLEFTFTIDDQEKLALLAQLDVDKTSDSTRYTPLVEIRTPNMKTVTLKGYGVVQPGSRFITYLTLENLSEQLIEFKGRFLCVLRRMS